MGETITDMENPDVIVVGAGLSGMSSAVRLVDEGVRVLILEERDVIGGRTSSWHEKGMEVESGLHRYLGVFKELPELLEHVGIDLNTMLVWEDEIEIKMPDSQPSSVFGLSIFKPLETLGGLLNTEFISIEDKTALVKFFSEGFTLFKKDTKKLDTYTVEKLAKENNLKDEVIERVLIPLTEGLFFLTPQKYSALNFFALFSPYLSRIHTSRVGGFRGGMTEIMMKPLSLYIQNKSGEIRSKSKVNKIVIEDGKVAGVIVNKRKFRTNNVVLAVSLYSAQQLIKASFMHLWFEEMLSLDSMPAVTFQIELKEPSMEVDRTTFSPGTIFSSYSEQSRTTFQQSKGRLSIILSNPKKWLVKNEKEILKQILADAKRLNLNLSEKTIKSYRKIAWPQDFYSYEKGTYGKRPIQKTPITGLFLAGDYTKQKYLSTMEGAVMSGKLAAEATLSR